MKLFNTKTKQVDGFKPSGDEVTLYSCGPTVYDNAHIGNLSSYIYADTLKRALKVSGFKVKHVMNVTDVNDKIIKRSVEKYPDLDPKEAMTKLALHYEGVFLNDMKKIGSQLDDIIIVRATDSVDGMQQLIKDLLNSGIAYIADDGVYFSLEAYKKAGRKYGQLVKLSEESTSKERIKNDEYDKDSVHDFALWKKQTDGEPAWGLKVDGQDMAGRPGWHIECSVMSTNELGQPFDIHTGGIDLIFPHHENEIAQSTGASDDDIYSRFFVHNEHLLVDGKKMSKSLGNFYTLEDIEKKGYEPLTFRLLVLQSHFQSKANFTWESLDGATQRLKNLRNMAVLRFQTVDHSRLNVNEVVAAGKNAIQDNLDTPQVLKALSDLAQQAEDHLVAKEDLEDFEDALQFFDDALGLDLLQTEDISKEQEQLIKDREKARESKDYGASDQLRDQLQSQGIGVRDTEQGSVWFLV